jgi:hypothetical protein
MKERAVKDSAVTLIATSVSRMRVEAQVTVMTRSCASMRSASPVSVMRPVKTPRSTVSERAVSRALASAHSAMWVVLVMKIDVDRG